jgi:hypothetical protein
MSSKVVSNRWMTAVHPCAVPFNAGGSVGGAVATPSSETCQRWLRSVLTMPSSADLAWLRCVPPVCSVFCVSLENEVTGSG